MKTIFIILFSLLGIGAFAQFPPYVHNQWDTNDQSVLPTPSNVLTSNKVGSMAYQSTNDFLYNLSTVRPEQFGATAMRTLYDVTTTSNSAAITSASGNFTSADVGKSVVVYSDAHHTNWLISTISSVDSGTQVTLTDTVLWTLSNDTINYGFDSAPAFQSTIDWCYTNGIHNIALSNCVYMLIGSLTLTGTNQYSVIHFPAPTYTATNKIFNLNITGVAAADYDFSGYFQYAAPRSGSIIYCPTKYSGTNGCVFGMNCLTAKTFTSFGTIWKNVAFMQPCRPQLTEIDDRYGGHLSLEHWSIFPDFAANMINADIGGSGNMAAGVVFATTQNSAAQDSERGFVIGFDIAAVTSEHVQLTDTTFGANGVGLWINNGAGTWCSQLKLINNITNIIFSADGGYHMIYGTIYAEVTSSIAKQNLDNVFTDLAAGGEIFLTTTATNYYAVNGVNSIPGNLVIHANVLSAQSTTASRGEFSSGNSSYQQATNDILVGGKYPSGNQAPVGLYFLPQYGQSVRQIGEGGEYIFDRNGKLLATWNISGGSAALGTLYLSNLTANGSVSGNGGKMTNLVHSSTVSSGDDSAVITPTKNTDGSTNYDVNIRLQPEIIDLIFKIPAINQSGSIMHWNGAEYSKGPWGYSGPPFYPYYTASTNANYCFPTFSFTPELFYGRTNMAVHLTLASSNSFSIKNYQYYLVGGAANQGYTAPRDPNYKVLNAYVPGFGGSFTTVMMQDINAVQTTNVSFNIAMPIEFQTNQYTQPFYFYISGASGIATNVSDLYYLRATVILQ